MRHARSARTLAIASALTGLVLVAPALSSSEPPPRPEAAVLKLAGAAPARAVRPHRVPDAARVQPVARPQEEARAGAAEGCVKSRRKLWIEGEGWHIRRVAICS
jgi:hypothetical protein